MNAIAQLFDPILLMLAAASPFGIGSILFVLYRRGPSSVGMRPGLPLSWAEPIEIRIVIYLLFAAIWGVIAFALRILHVAVPEGGVAAGLLLVLTMAAFFFDMAFVYAAAGTLLQAALGSRGRPPFWFSKALSPLDTLLMTIGDVLASVLLRQRPALRHAPAETTELDFETETLGVGQPGTKPAMSPLHTPRVKREDPYAVAKERLDSIVADYQRRLTPAQREKYLLMREIVEYLRGRDLSSP